MTARTTAQQLRWQETGRPVLTALLLAALGALLLAAGPLLGVFAKTPEPIAGVSWALILGSAVPVLVAALGWWTGRPTFAAGALLAPGLFAVGRLLIDLQLFIKPSQAWRPELFVVRTVDPLDPGLGLYVLLLGQVITAVAGWLALRTVKDTEQDNSRTRVPNPQLWIGLCLVLGLAALGSLFYPLLGSTDLMVLGKSYLDSPAVVLFGGAVLALAVPIAGATAIGLSDVDGARGGLLGVGAAALGYTLPTLALSAQADAISTGIGTWLILVSALIVAGFAYFVGSRKSRGVPLRVVAGRLMVLAGLFALFAANAYWLVLSDGYRLTEAPDRALLWWAGALLIVLGCTQFAPAIAGAVRPVLSLAWALVPMAGAGQLGNVLLQRDVYPGTQTSYGLLFFVLALALAIAGSITAAVAGSVEREEVDLSEVRAAPLRVGLSALLGLLALLAFAGNTVQSPDLLNSGLFTDVNTATLGLYAGLAVVLAACVLAPVSRLHQAAALYLGAALVLAFRLLGWPVMAGVVNDPERGDSALWVIAGLLVAVVSAVVTLAARNAKENVAL
ncbi:hypothetical protein D5S17_11235 [Pseudonocardiaceae bacterium YIM PH 21723]|nr:hypothetical protein D5S17_11235 [Pseudonocardiaceae bacterium YIM PH 21723]